MNKVVIYTDGAAKGNPGVGGYGVVMLYGNYRKELSMGYRLTTNNRMELLAVIIGLEMLLRPCEVTIYTDSQYVVNSVEKKWVFTWEKNDFKAKKNPDLWARFLKVYRTHVVKFIWIRGHSNIKENERCDQLAVQASQSTDLQEDIFYVNSKD